MRFLTLLMSTRISMEKNHGSIKDLSIIIKEDKAYIQYALLKFSGKKPAWYPVSQMDFQKKILLTDEPILFDLSGLMTIKRSLLLHQCIDLSRKKIIYPFDFIVDFGPKESELVSIIYGFPTKSVSWSDFLLVNNTHYAKFLRFHPADTAYIVEHLSVKKQVKILSQLPENYSAFVLSEIDTKRQAPLLELLNPELAVKMLVTMPKNHAANILRDVGEARKYLCHMDQQTKEEISMLLSYDPDAVGGLMDSEFIKLKEDSTSLEAIQYLRELSPSSESIYYLYVIDKSGVFKGVLTIRSLLTADPNVKLMEIMKKNLISIPANTTREEIAHIMSRYHLLALPVVDDANRIVGVIKIHDVLESTLEYPV